MFWDLLLATTRMLCPLCIAIKVHHFPHNFKDTAISPELSLQMICPDFRRMERPNFFNIFSKNGNLKIYSKAMQI